MPTRSASGSRRRRPGLLALLGIDADPVRSREHIFLSTLLDAAWRAGKDLDLRQLIQDIQRPPFEQSRRRRSGIVLSRRRIARSWR